MPNKQDVMAMASLSNIADELATKSGLIRDAADNFVHAFVASIEKGLQDDNVVKIKGMGTFKLQEVGDRESIDVNTGERIIIKGYRKVTFTPDSVMKELVNRPFAHFEPVELNDGFPVDGEETLISSGNITEEYEKNDTIKQSMADDISEVKSMIAGEETNVEEPIVEKEIEPIIEEQSTEVIEQEAAVKTSDKDVVEVPETIGKTAQIIAEETCQSEIKPKKHRNLRLLITLFLFGGIVGVYHWFFCVSTSDEQPCEMEEYADMMVNPNLKEELGEEWGDEPKSMTEFSTEDTTADDIKVQTVGSTESVELADAILFPSKEIPSYTLELTKSLLAKNLKDVTSSDTTDYIFIGTLVTHKLKHGETIIQLSKLYYGDKRLWPYIAVYNRMKDFNNVAVGQEIQIPLLREK